MKKENIALGLSAIATVISIIAVCIVVYRVEPFTYNNMTLIISILVAAVTIYMFINIINELFLEKRIRSLLKKDIEKNTNDILFHNMYLTFFFQGANELRITHNEAALYYLFKSIECLMKTSIDRDKLDEIILKISTIKQYGAAMRIDESEINSYIEIMASTGHKKSTEIIEFLISIKK